MDVHGACNWMHLLVIFDRNSSELMIYFVDSLSYICKLLFKMIPFCEFVCSLSHPNILYQLRK